MMMTLRSTAALAVLLLPATFVASWDLLMGPGCESEAAVAWRQFCQRPSCETSFLAFCNLQGKESCQDIYGAFCQRLVSGMGSLEDAESFNQGEKYECFFKVEPTIPTSVPTTTEAPSTTDTPSTTTTSVTTTERQSSTTSTEVPSSTSTTETPSSTSSTDTPPSTTTTPTTTTSEDVSVLPSSSSQPTVFPSMQPTVQPSVQPTVQPTAGTTTQLLRAGRRLGDEQKHHNHHHKHHHHSHHHKHHDHKQHHHKHHHDEGENHEEEEALVSIGSAGQCRLLSTSGLIPTMSMLCSSHVMLDHCEYVTAAHCGHDGMCVITEMTALIMALGQGAY